MDYLPATERDTSTENAELPFLYVDADRKRDGFAYPKPSFLIKTRQLQFASYTYNVTSHDKLSIIDCMSIHIIIHFRIHASSANQSWQTHALSAAHSSPQAQNLQVEVPV